MSAELIQIGNPSPRPALSVGGAPGLGGTEKLAVASTAVGALLFLASFLVPGTLSGWGPLLGSTILFAGGASSYFWLVYRDTTPGIKNHGLFSSSTTARGAIGWLLGVALTGFYCLLYWFPAPLEGGIRLLDPLAVALSGKAATQWFLYGFLYTVAVLVMGLRMILRYRHNRYQILRTCSVMFFQLGFGFVIPNVLKALNQPEFYFTYFWPLKPEYLLPFSQGWTIDGGSLGMAMIVWGAAMTFLATPVLTYLYGKRWYCSWVCGCGGLAETMGDPFRQLSSKSETAWRIERWMIHSVLVLIVVVTAVGWGHDLLGRPWWSDGGQALYYKTYGFFIGSVFSGVIGVGFYPLMGSRVWCRFGCPMAAALGIFQRFFSRFRITTNGGQCISCGNCSTYCEMGIDVRAYAQRGENIVRASCVGCGVCAAVCPRGVLKLETGPVGDRFVGADTPVRAAMEALGLADRR
jgi:ferredoxin-type protein NapH